MGKIVGPAPVESLQDLSTALERANAKLSLLTEQAERNSTLLRRSQERELELLQAQNLAELLRRMTTGLKRSYDLDQVNVVLADPDHDVRHLLVADRESSTGIPGVSFLDTLAGLTPHYVALRRPWLGPFNAPDHQLLFASPSGLKSIALIPLIHQGALFGSINFGSADKSRFTGGHASDFFAHLGVIASFSLENAVNRARLLRSGFTDSLTGWHNRRYLQVRLTEELARAQRDSSTLVCLMLDIDHFKQVNDSYGHGVGDQVLREIAQRIESEVRVSDVAARYGGEEFVVLLPNTTEDSGRLLAERVRRAIGASLFQTDDGHAIKVTVSIGTASVTPSAGDSELKTLGEALIARADVALYDAKRAGRDRVSCETGSVPAPPARVVRGVRR